LLRARRYDQLDIENVAGKIEDLGKAEQKAVRSHMLRLLVHQIKRRLQPEKETASWRRSILNSQYELEAALQDSPSLRKVLESSLPAIYRRSVYSAGVESRMSTEGLPEHCPFKIKQLLRDFDLKWPQ
jgi:hypothetical protein